VRPRETLEINYNFLSKVYKKLKVRSIDLKTDKLFLCNPAKKQADKCRVPHNLLGGGN